MESRLLIDAIVRQTTVLIAAISTASGIRAPLAHIADQVFLDLAREIESHGVGRKVVADMFGVALRTYQKKVRRLAESTSVRGRSLWEAVFQCVLDNTEITREALETRFHKDEPSDLAAVIHDLVVTGQLEAEGRGKQAVYRAVDGQAGRVTGSREQVDALASLVWGEVYRASGATLRSLADRLAVAEADLHEPVARLQAEGRIEVDELPDGDRALSASRFLLPVGASQGWEAAVFDHFSAVATAIASKLQAGPGSRANDRVGGATLSFDLSESHPHQAEVYGLLANIRAQVNELWDRVSTYNRDNPIDPQQRINVSFYFGQNVQAPEPSSKEQKNA